MWWVTVKKANSKKTKITVLIVFTTCCKVVAHAFRKWRFEELRPKNDWDVVHRTNKHVALPFLIDPRIKLTTTTQV